MKKFYLETHGCQMNVLDSEKASFSLKDTGYEATDDPLEADLIMLNTCMVREKPENKVFSRIGQVRGEIAALKTGKPLPIFGVMGCVAQAEAERIFDRSADVRLVIGTQSIGKLPELLGQLEQGFPRAIDVTLTRDAGFFELDAGARLTPHVAYISIIEGCNKFCSFCIVPYTRGRERSRPADRILDEARNLAANGYKEVHLLGQNVNSYGLSGRLRGNLSAENQKTGKGELTFAQLLDLLARESGIPRIKYTTSHPRDFDEEIVRVMDQHESLCEWVHLPVQAGSDRVLRMMRRGYTRDEYLRKIDAVRRATKDMSITTDIIVGFPGETDQDFDDTLSLAAEVEYDGMYIFNYSARPKTPASALVDDVKPEVKSERFLKLQELQSRIQKRRYGRYIGKTVEVLVEGFSARSEADLTGHTRCHKVVNFSADKSLIGKRALVRIDVTRANSLSGTLLEVMD